MTDTTKIAAARIDVARTRASLLETARELQARLQPKTIAGEVWEKAKDKGADIAEGAVDAVAKRPLAVGSVVAAIAILLVLVTWVFFRAANLPSALRYLGDMAGLGEPQTGAALIGGIIYQPYYALTMGMAAAVVWLCPQTWDWTRTLTAPKAAIAFAALLLAIAALTTQAYNPFIYFIF